MVLNVGKTGYYILIYGRIFNKNKVFRQAKRLQNKTDKPLCPFFDLINFNFALRLVETSIWWLDDFVISFYSLCK